MADMAQDNFSGNCTVVDSPKVIWSLVWGVLFLGFGLFLLYASIKQGTHNGITYFLIALGVLNLIRFRVNAKGYVVDVEGDTLEFPGGGIEAQSWTTYFNPLHWFQGLMRHSVPLSEVREVEAYVDRQQKVDDKGRVSTTTRHILDVNGEFGAISFSFRSKGKRDELYSALVQINDMGTPVLNR
ncbi:hypothetical protein [Bilophila wadsworthia]|uniref:hypothetical protein n=1 Tax=Bilophila wadsworthia TaxID=35833 RepID=UPI0032619B25